MINKSPCPQEKKYGLGVKNIEVLDLQGKKLKLWLKKKAFELGIAEGRKQVLEEVKKIIERLEKEYCSFCHESLDELKAELSKLENHSSQEQVGTSPNSVEGVSEGVVDNTVKRKSVATKHNPHTPANSREGKVGTK